MKTLAALGEDAVVSALTRQLPTRPDVRVGAGDDCAVIGGPRDEWWQLLKTDVVIEGIHFLPEEKPERIGAKALNRAISDIAAMGGLPQHALVTLAIRPDVTLDWVKRLYAGLSKAAKKADVAIVGGETSRSPGPLFLNIALTGKVERRRCVLRSGGKTGDRLFVTGRLGGSIAGKHLDFAPRLAEARWLVEHFSIHAMMDLSDGLGSDVPRLAAASGCGFELVPESLPRTPGCTVEQALGDGEDFELLLAVAPRDAAPLQAAWAKQFPKLPLTEIGRLISKSDRPARTSQRAKTASAARPLSPSTARRSGGANLPTRGHDHFA